MRNLIGIVAPAQTPRAIVERLNREIVAILKQKDVEQDLLGQGAIPVGDTPEHFGGCIKTEMAKWAPW